MSALLEPPRPPPQACVHDRRELLGNDGTATFYRCAACGSVMILQAGIRWVLRAAMLP